MFVLPVASAKADAVRTVPPARAACVAAASQRYGVPDALIWAVMRTEGGTTGQTSRPNRNGTVDLGLMQINEVHLRNPPHNLASQGITRELLVNNECLNIMIGTYILSVELAKPSPDGMPYAEGYWWNIGAYNSRTPCSKFADGKCPNMAYQKRVLANLVKVLEGR